MYVCFRFPDLVNIGFCPDPKHFIVDFEENSIVKFAEKLGKMLRKMQYLNKIF